MFLFVYLRAITKKIFVRANQQNNFFFFQNSYKAIKDFDENYY